MRHSLPEQQSLQQALIAADILHQQQRFHEALTLYDSLLTKHTENALLWNNRGVTLMALLRHQNAAENFSRALEITPELHPARIALATCYQALGLFEQALDCCNLVLDAEPDNAEAHWNKSLLLLLRGVYKAGWQEYEWRWHRQRFSSPRHTFPQPLWQGEFSNNRTILVHAEQGFGDTLQFCRYLPFMTQQGMSVVFTCHPPLASLMQTLSPAIAIFPFGDALPDFDCHIPLLSLPRIFNTDLESIPSTVPYLHPPEPNTAIWQQRLAACSNKRLKVGLCWSGKQYPDPLRSCPSQVLQPFADICGIDWYSLQCNRQGDLPFPMNDLTEGLNDFADSAALISRLDLVITIDTAIAHLAGALGVNSWVMLPFIPDWRWLLERNDSPWYPTMKLYRQDCTGNWHSVIRNITDSLHELVLHRQNFLNI